MAFCAQLTSSFKSGRERGGERHIDYDRDRKMYKQTKQKQNKEEEEEDINERIHKEST